MIRAKNYETVSTFGKVMQRKLLTSFFPDTVYNVLVSPDVNELSSTTFYFAMFWRRFRM